MSDNTNDHAEVGALLAKCDNFNVFPHPQTYEWCAIVYIKGSRGTKTGATQLAAIRAAVEAAEKGST